MNILIAGASGFIGQELVRALQDTDEITVLGRNEATLQRTFSKNNMQYTWNQLSQLDAKRYDIVINLCGYNIAASRWSIPVKKQLIDSRVNTNALLINWITSQKANPRYFCANAIGIYGLQENGDSAAFDEDTPIDFANPRDFLSEIGIRWQQALQPALDYGLRVATTRFGVVLKKGNGMLKKLAPVFYFGLGHVIGDGKQIISWVHIDDVVGGIKFLLNNPECTGAYNITSPNPVSQATFARDLAKSMHRPLLVRLPAFVIHTLFGEMGDCLLLKGQRVLPKHLLDAGYVFQYPELATALTHEFA